ncbi:aminotransferase class I/II-fold pyridoxal phosphate-dependent enzyme [Alphaproteobacteria bacterium]|nr:aminotransferase class I/II-fold pyridoxal phosphate-dependent enzyme [Alphaproteobacteria bacterium]
MLAHNASLLETESAFDVLARAEALNSNGRRIINLGIGQPDFKTSAHIVEAAIQALKDGHHGYTPAPGLPNLKEALVQYYADHFGQAIDSANILVVPGGKVTMAFAMLLLGEPGREILYPDPGFPIYRSMAAYSGASAVPYAVHEELGFSFKASEILEKLTPHTRLIILNSPGNPTGGTNLDSEVEALVAGLRDFPNCAVLSDEIYSRLHFDDRQHQTLLKFEELRDRLIVLDGWSKTYAMTGWRLGWGIWPSSMIGAATKLAINVHSCVNAPAQFAAQAALQGPQDAVNDMRSAFQDRRDLVHQRLNAMPGISAAKPKGAFYAFPNISALGMPSKHVQDIWLEELGIATIAGTSFGEAGSDYIRLSFANSMENINEALDKIETWVRSL